MPVSAYNRFVKKHRKAGKSMKQIGALWRSQKPGTTSKKKSSGGSKVAATKNTAKPRRKSRKKSAGLFPNPFPSKIEGDFGAGFIGNGILTALVGGAVAQKTGKNMNGWYAQVATTVLVPILLNQHPKTRKAAPGALWGGVAIMAVHMFLDQFANKRLKELAKRAQIYGIEGVALQGPDERLFVCQPNTIRESLQSTFGIGLGLGQVIPPRDPEGSAASQTPGEYGDQYPDPDMIRQDPVDPGLYAAMIEAMA